MKIVVCVRPGADGEIGPFDAAALECALRVPGAEAELLSMAPPKGAEVLLRLTRLGAKHAYLLSDPAFAGSDTLATSYVLSLALERLKPDLVLCGRKTLEGDTGQVGAELAERCGFSLAAEVLEILGEDGGGVRVRTRENDEKRVTYPALLCMERVAALRFPGIFSKPGDVTVWNAADLGADVSRCGNTGSPTRVLYARENARDRRKCTWISPAELDGVIRTALKKKRAAPAVERAGELPGIYCVGERARAAAGAVSGCVQVLEPEPAAALAEKIRERNPTAVFFDTAPESRELAARLAVLLETGLCADCTALEVQEGELLMVRPAFAGDRIAGIVCRTRPALATLRAEDTTAGELIFTLGMGAKPYRAQLTRLAERYGAELGATRAAVDDGWMPYPAQIGLTGRSVAPAVYVAFGVSGAVHHIAGMKSAGTVIAVNRDKSAPIFDYADYGIAADLETL